MKLIDQTPESLVAYTAAQSAALTPDGSRDRMAEVMGRHVDEALARIGHCIDNVAMWRAGEFNYLHSSQYCIYLYYLANTIWKREKDAGVATRLFLLNKALNGIDLFYEIEMPPVFFIGHSVGIVLAKATYGNYLVLYQNSTVGRHRTDIPVIGDGVIVYPNSAIIGRSRVGDGAVLSQGSRVVNLEVPAKSMAFPGPDGGMTFRPAPQDLLSDYFRL
jgi:serine O-acetyltransferase